MRTLRDHAEGLILAEPTHARRQAARTYLVGRQVVAMGRFRDGRRAALARRLRLRAEGEAPVAELSTLLAAAVDEAGGAACPAWLVAREPRLEGLETYEEFVRFLLDAPAGREVLRVRERGRTVFLRVDAVFRGAPQAARLPYAMPFAEQLRRWVRSLGWEHLMYVMGRYLGNRTARIWLDRREVTRLHAEVVVRGGRLRVLAPLLRAALRRHGSPLFVPLLEVVEPWFDGVASHPWVIEMLADAPGLPPAVALVERDGLAYLAAVPGTSTANDVVLS